MRPAVLRQYFGRDVEDMSDNSRDDAVFRFAYGVGSGSTSVGIHPRHCTTEEMPLAMMMVADHVYNYLHKEYKPNSSVRIEPFNHCSVLIYYQKSGNDKKSSAPMIGFHTDNVYNFDGLFMEKLNSQLENTFTVLLSLGDTRELKFQRQITSVKDNKRMSWVSGEGIIGERVGDKNTRRSTKHCGKKEELSFSIKHGSLFLLHPDDERPKVIYDDGTRQRYQHGNIMFPRQDKISFVLAFRVVTSKELMHR